MGCDFVEGRGCRRDHKAVRAKHLFEIVLMALCAAATVGCHYRVARPVAMPAANRMASAIPSALPPAEALRVYESGARRQLSTLVEYSDATTISAEIPKTSEKGQVSLTETFSAPRTLAYTGVRFVGSGFVKNNVIVRLLQADVEHVHRRRESETAILDSNYKFSFKRAETVAGRLLYKFAVTPRRKCPELFEGEILLDSWTGHIVRAGGRLSKSPSWWIKRIDFTEDYADVGEFTMPVQISSVTEARIIGRVVATIRHRAYEVRSIDQVQAEGRLTLRTAAIRQSAER